MHVPQKILIIGLGLIGGSLALALRRFGDKRDIYAVDNPYTIEKALQTETIDRGFTIDKVAEAIPLADIIIVATPIDVCQYLLPVIAATARDGSIVTDTASIKGSVMAIARREFAAGRCHFFGGHPMAGTERAGFDAGDPFLFENALYTITPMSEEYSKVAFETLILLIQQIGSQPVLLDAATHDEIAAAVSHMPRMLSVALMEYIVGKNRKNSLYLKMAAGGFKDMTRIASGQFGFWREVLHENKGNVIRAIDGLVEELEKLKTDLQSENLEAKFTDAIRNRLSIPSDTKGFLNRLYDLVVEVEDKHGVIAEISGRLHQKNINIKDIEVLKVRENEGGTIRLAFSTQRDCMAAESVLAEIGYRCRTPQ
jgi:prephenate dehydrogenase